MKQITSLEEFNQKSRVIKAAHNESDYVFLFTDEDEFVVISGKVGITPITPDRYDNLDRTRDIIIARREKTQVEDRFDRLTSTEMRVLQNILRKSAHPEGQKLLHDVMVELEKRQGESK